jgi:hypothetical protein
VSGDGGHAQVHAMLLRQLHDTTHVGPGKLTHPRCPHCKAECPEGWLTMDAPVREALGLMGGDDA